MLETTLNSKFVPGTNLAGGLGRVDWRFLLPSLNVDNVLCVGVPPARTLIVLAGVAPLVLVGSDRPSQLRDGRRPGSQMVSTQVLEALTSPYS